MAQQPTCNVLASGPTCYSAYASASSSARTICRIPGCRPYDGCRVSKTFLQLVKEEKNNDRCEVEIEYSLQCVCPF